MLSEIKLPVQVNRKLENKGKIMSQFKVGDVVKLKSGGPKMTVSSIDEDGYIGCTWFIENKREGDSFMEATLDLEKYETNITSG